MVKIGGVDYLVDACWGAGHVKDGAFQFEFNPHYFLAPPDVFVTDHLPGIFHECNQPKTR
jgi:transglutaminase/protease-like cytokinesis protein 3